MHTWDDYEAVKHTNSPRITSQIIKEVLNVLTWAQKSFSINTPILCASVEEV